MSGIVKTGLQVAFLIVFIWVLAALFGAAPGASVRGPGFSARIGPGRKRKRRWMRRIAMPHTPFAYVSKAVALAPSGGGEPPLIGRRFF